MFSLHSSTLSLWTLFCLLSNVMPRALCLIQHPQSLRKFTTLNCRPSACDFTPHRGCFPWVCDNQWAQLKILAEGIIDWNSKINLISRQDVAEVIPNHFLPSLSISHVRSFAVAERIIDVGTGGGFPGLPLAILNPEAHFTLLDSNNKKMMVVRDLVTTLGLPNVEVICDRAEKVDKKFDFILGRAVSAIPNFLSFSSHLLDKNSNAGGPSKDKRFKMTSGLLYLKGGDYAEEIAAAGININNVQSFNVRDMIKSTSEKYVLYIPQDEIVGFARRQSSISPQIAKQSAGKPQSHMQDAHRRTKSPHKKI